MGLFSKLFSGSHGRVDRSHATPSPLGSKNKRPVTARHTCNFETLEERRLLAADINFGSVYFEEATGDDSAPDTIEITFEGGADGTELTQVVIDGDKLADGGVTLADVFFDTEDGGLGAFNSVGLDLQTPVGFNITGVTLGDGTGSGDGEMLLTIDLEGFTAGDKLIFTVDVDEMGLFSATALAEGGEFEGSRITGTFEAPHYLDAEGTATYFDLYDANFATTAAQTGSTLDLPPDNYMPPHAQDRSDRTAGAVLGLTQTPKPITISGTVYEDVNLDLSLDGGDNPLENVDLTLMRLDGSTYVSTGLTTQTDVNGDYLFDDASLVPGTYRVVETQPTGFLSVESQAGFIGATQVGVETTPDIISQITIQGGEDSVDNDFLETRPASLCGVVYHDRNNDGVMDPGEEGIGGVTVRLDAVDVLGGNPAPISVVTSADGTWCFENLMPGEYNVVELQPAGWIDGIDVEGNAGGTAVNPGDEINSIVLAGGQAGINYKFGEYKPSTISGRVHADSDGDCDYDPGEVLIEGVEIQLLDANDNVIATTLTDTNGEYEFSALPPGRYGIREIQPAGYLDGTEHVGSVGGKIDGNDKIIKVDLESDTQAVRYDFCEILPGEIRGIVHIDPDRDCVVDPGEQRLEGVTIQLLDTSGNVIATTQTDVNGEYLFDNLAPGTYGVRELQPGGFLHGGQTVGSGTGIVAGEDLLTEIEIGSGAQLVDYNFCELEPGSITGFVFSDPNQDCNIDPEEVRLEGVTVELLDAAGNVIATTQTDANGQYMFDNLMPDTYAVREQQPDGFFHGGQMVGSGSGTIAGNDWIKTIEIGSGEDLVDYNFCEHPPASLSGFVFQDGDTLITADGLPPDDLSTYRDGQLTADDTRLEGVTLELRNGVTGDVIDGNDALPGTYPAGPIRTTTDANGFYEFTGLRAGNYAVYEVQPADLFDGIDTPGTTGGIAINPEDTVSTSILALLNEDPRDDAILRIALFTGEHSQHNNFSEVAADKEPWIPPETPEPPLTPPIVFVPPTPTTPPVAPITPTIDPVTPDYGGSGKVVWHTWHLSVVNAGQPRTNYEENEALVNHGEAVFLAAAFADTPLDAGRFSIEKENGDAWQFVLGHPNATPVVGDFNGDGVDEVGLYVDGEWFIDLNGNGVWDDADLWAKLGTGDDLPVTGDWDGDGKDDIGIFGPAWPGDPRAVRADPGIPDPANLWIGKPKNLPPKHDEAAQGHRELQLSDGGKQRADLVDHVFAYGGPTDEPISGDWNGDGIQTIGVFRNGDWHLDVDGDGRWTDADKTVRFGDGDPVVGDFNGDGIDDLGVFDNGKWTIDSNGNHQLDSTDKVFELGGAGDKPVVGDWNGDGIDQPGVYHPGTIERTAEAPGPELIR